MSRALDDALDSLLGLLLLVLTGLVLAFLFALLLGGFLLVREMTGRSAPAAPPAPTTMFGAPAPVRWLGTYDYWLYQLEVTTGIAFSTTPARLWIGCLLVSAGPAALVGLAIDVLSAEPGLAATALVTALGGTVGVLTSVGMTRSAAGWFVAEPDLPAPLATGREDGPIRLGEDVERW